jgi:hypothetical protein
MRLARQLATVPTDDPEWELLRIETGMFLHR